MKVVKLLLIAVACFVVLLMTIGFIGWRAGAKQQAPSTTVATPSVPPLPVSAAAPMPGAPAGPELVWASAATFTHDELVVCLDVALDREAFLAAMARVKEAQGMSPEGLLGEDVRVFLQAGDTLLAAALKKQGGTGAFTAAAKEKDVTALRQVCAKQFPSRTALGTCSAKLGREGRGQLELMLYSALANDRAMKECIAIGGDWKEVDRNSLEGMRARHQQMFRQLQNEN